MFTRTYLCTSTCLLRARWASHELHHRQVLVVDNGGLAGIFTEKDMLNRVLSKGKNPDEVSVSDVMTPNPDTVPSTMTVLEALQEVTEDRK